MSRINGTMNGHAKPVGVGRRSKADAALDELRASIFGSISSQVMALGGYDTARPSRTRPNQAKIRGGSADSHLDPWTRDSLARQCRDLERNSSLARGLVERQVDLVTGDGFGLEATTTDASGGAGSQEWNAAAAYLFNLAAGELEDGAPLPALLKGKDLGAVKPLDVRERSNQTELSADVLRRWNFEGDVGFAFLDTDQIQAVEGERIRNPSRGQDRGITGGKEPANPIVGGVEMDAAGRPLRYHVATWNTLGNLYGPAGSVAVPAEHFALLVNPLRKVTGLTRGEPQLQAAVKRIEHLEAMDEGVIIAMRIQTAIAAVIQLQRPDLDLTNTPGSTETRPEDGASERWEEIEGGIIKRLGDGENVVFPPPSQPGAMHEAYILLQVLIVCAEMGLPIPVAMLDGRQLNLSTIRCITQIANKRTERLQKALKAFWARVYRWRTARFIRQGYLPFRADWMAHEWLPPPPPVMDPKVDLEEARGLVDARFKSAKRVMREKYGINKATEWPEIADEQEEMKELGIEPVAAPGSGAAKGGEEPAAAEKPDGDASR